MSNINTLSDLISPVSLEEFFATHHHKRSLHIPGSPDKAEGVFDWNAFNALLNMDVWTPNTMQLSLDRQSVPPSVFCDSMVNRNKQNILQPNREKVRALLARGASLVLNEIETLTPSVGTVVDALKQALNAKASANLYCSWQRHQAFDSHYDRHDVYAVQIYGEKIWNIYEGRADNPVEHPMFHNIPQADYDRMKGPVASRVALKPGDVLYLPRGQFHDALAESGVSVHITFSCAEPLGLDLVQDMMTRAVGDAAFRSEFPRLDQDDTDEAIAQHIATLMTRLASFYKGQDGVAIVKALIRRFAPIEPGFNLPRREAESLYRLKSGDWKVVRRGKKVILKSASEVYDLAQEEREILEWIVQRQRFKGSELTDRFSDMDTGEILARLKKDAIIVAN